MGATHYPSKRSKQQKRTNLELLTQKTIKELIITLALMITILSGAFLFINSTNSQLGYELQQEKLKNEYLKKENLKLQTKITESTAVSEIENKISKMTNSDNKDFVGPDDNKL